MLKFGLSSVMRRAIDLPVRLSRLRSTNEVSLTLTVTRTAHAYPCSKNQRFWTCPLAKQMEIKTRVDLRVDAGWRYKRPS